MLAPASVHKKPKRHSTGAPSQLNQGSRKGKRAWRKNVDIQDVEAGLEDIRAEERLTGSALQKKADNDLFAIDVTGDVSVRHTLPRFSTSRLTSTKILAQRSAIPPIASRVLPPSKKKLLGPSVSYADKTRLLRIGKRPRRGPFNAVMDPTEVGAGSALLEVTEAVKESGKYDAWDSQTGAEHTSKPQTGSHPRSLIELPAVVEPHQGTSYNPPVLAHQELLRTAHGIEEKRVKTAEEHKNIREKIALARQQDAEDFDEGLPTGMKLDQIDDLNEQVTGDSDFIMATRPVPERKTRQQRRKAEKQRAERRALAEKLAKRRLHSSVTTAKSLLKSLNQSTSSRERVRARKQLLLKEKLKRGLGGQRFGKHVVKEGDVDVQLGEDLSESLRALKPEGNLFRDRFISMQQRALVEPRAPVQPKKTRIKFKETEKHAWKRVD